MSPLFKKLNLGEHRSIHVLDAPASFAQELAQLDNVEIRTSVSSRDRVAFALAFTVAQAGLDAVSRSLCAAAEGDAVLWIAYPKGTSKNYTCEFNRDSGWSVLKAAGFDTVRQVAIDQDWSALRFRRVAFIGGGRAAKHS